MDGWRGVVEEVEELGLHCDENALSNFGAFLVARFLSFGVDWFLALFVGDGEELVLRWH